MGPSGSNPLPVAQLVKRGNLSSYILFVEGLLHVGAAARLETPLKILLLGSTA